MKVFNFREVYPGLASIFRSQTEERRSGGVDALWSFYNTRIHESEALSVFRGGRVVADLLSLKQEALRIVDLGDGIPCVPVLPGVSVRTMAAVLKCDFDGSRRDDIFEGFNDQVSTPNRPYLLGGVEVCWCLDQESAVSPESGREHLAREEKTGHTFLEGLWLAFFFREILDFGFMDFGESITADGQIPHLFKFNGRLILGKAPVDRAHFLWGLPTCRMRLTS